MHNIVQIGATIAELRTERGLKQKQLSAILGMSPGNLSNYEHGVYWPALDTMCKIADLFNVSTDFLLGRTGFRCPPDTFTAYITPDYTIHHIVNILLALDSSSLDAVLKFACYLKDTGEAAKPPGKQPCRKPAVSSGKTDQLRSSRP